MSEVVADGAMDGEMDDQMDEMEGMDGEMDENAMEEEDEENEEGGEKPEFEGKKEFVARPWHTDHLESTIKEVEGFAIRNSR